MCLGNCQTRLSSCRRLFNKLNTTCLRRYIFSCDEVNRNQTIVWKFRLVSVDKLVVRISFFSKSELMLEKGLVEELAGLVSVARDIERETRRHQKVRVG